MIREMSEDEFVREFFEEFAELECGDHYHADDPQHVEWVRRRIAIHCFRGARFFSCEADGGTPAGFGAVLIDPGLEGDNCFGHKAELLDVMVRDEHRGQGHGRALLEHAETLSREAGAYCIYVATYAGSRDAVAFYVHRGYVPVAMHPDVYGPDDDGRIYLRKVLEGRPAR
ncbi:MAG: GNAT family N-acetyltransferase [Planctomycetota bacterium]|jgi:GNAT superfamily N-acetyltransferase